MREFETGATRDSDDGKPDYEGFLSPLVIRRFGEYMHKHRRQADGNLRASDNWQKGIPLEAYMKSGWRHFLDWWALHRCGGMPRHLLEDALCALLFNVQGYLHETLKLRVSSPTRGPIPGVSEPMPRRIVGPDGRVWKADGDGVLRLDSDTTGPRCLSCSADIGVLDYRLSDDSYRCASCYLRSKSDDWGRSY